MFDARISTLRTMAALGALLLSAAPAFAGPPLICNPFQIGTAQGLPWGQGAGWNTPDRNYDVQQLSGDTLKLLTPETPVIARMEIMRRAAIYAAQDRRIAAELLAALLARVVSAEARGARDPLAWFDAGYLVETYRQASDVYRFDMLSGAARSRWLFKQPFGDVDGYAWVQRALTLTSGQPEMEYAASLMKSGAAAEEHRRLAAAGAKSGSLLAINLAR